MKINQELGLLNEEQFLEFVSKSSYFLVADAKKLFKWFGVELFVINHLDDEKAKKLLIENEINSIGVEYLDHYSESDGHLFIGAGSEKIMCRAYFGKYIPASILFHELGHWIEYVEYYERDYELYGKDIAYAHFYIRNHLLAYDFTEAKAWVYGALTARIMDNTNGTTYYYSCLEQMCYENTSSGFDRPASDLAVYMMQRSVVSIKTKKSKKLFSVAVEHAIPIIEALEAEAHRFADFRKDVSTLLQEDPDRFEIDEFEDDLFEETKSLVPSKGCENDYS